MGPETETRKRAVGINVPLAASIIAERGRKPSARFGFAEEYFDYVEVRGGAYNRAIEDLNTVRRGINEALTRRKSQIRVHCRVPMKRPGPKKPFTPPELTRVLLAFLG